jgi:hypothetical protein
MRADKSFKFLENPKTRGSFDSENIKELEQRVSIFCDIIIKPKPEAG